MIEIFKTGVTTKVVADEIVKQLQSKIPGARINFDLDDCDNILRIDSDHDFVKPVTDHLTELGFYCEVAE
jgi:hypothetical protein